MRTIRSNIQSFDKGKRFSNICRRALLNAEFSHTKRGSYKFEINHKTESIHPKSHIPHKRPKSENFIPKIIFRRRRR